jgi:hypothetical protein
VRAANVCWLQKNTRDRRRFRTERASTSQRNGRVLTRQTSGGVDFHPLRLFPLCSSSPSCLPLCTERRCGLSGTFPSVLTSVLPLPFIFLSFFPFSAEQRYQWCSLQNTTRLDPGARSPGVEARYRSTIRRTYIPTQSAGGASSTSRRAGKWLFLGAHIYLCRFFFIMS